MKSQSAIADINIHLRARPQDRDLIDHAAELAGANRSQFMLATALKEAKSMLLDQSTIHADRETFRKVLDWLDVPATAAEVEGMERLAKVSPNWVRE